MAINVGIANLPGHCYKNDMPRTKSLSIDKFGRILIPKELRDAVGLTSGREVRMLADGGELRVIPEPSEPAIQDVGGVKVFMGRLPVGFDLPAAIDRDRAARAGHLARGRGKRKR